MSPPIAQLGHPALAAPIQNLELGMGIPASEGTGTKKVNDLTNSGVYFSTVFFLKQDHRAVARMGQLPAPWSRAGFLRAREDYSTFLPGQPGMGGRWCSNFQSTLL